MEPLFNKVAGLQHLFLRTSSNGWKKQRETERDRQTDRQRDGQTKRQTDKETEGQTDREIDRQRGR